VSGVMRATSMVGPNTFELANARGALETAADWDRDSMPRLWRYMLHYFDDLNAESAEERRGWHRALVDRWISEIAPGVGSAWEPYPVSLRIVNWIKWDLRERALGIEARHSLAAQVRWLCRRLEYHLLGNHLWANAKALVFAGAYFDGPEAAGWLTRGERVLRRQVAEQLLLDGGHFERSPMYHAIVLEDVLDLVNLTAAYPDAFGSGFTDLLCSRVQPMLDWLQAMSHPDGKISQFNDAAFGVSALLASLEEYAARLGVDVERNPLEAITALPTSGYYRLQNDDAVLICDLAPLGPDYLPAHGHADTLTFEMSILGQRVFVNSGTSTYEPGATRQAERQTLAHNTVIVDDCNSSDVWASFRVGRRAKPFGVEFGCRGDRLFVEGRHDGYRRLLGGATHRRRWTLGARELVVDDAITGRFRTATAYLHLHPDVRVTDHDDSSMTLSIGGVRSTTLTVSLNPRSRPKVSEIYWSPEFGLHLKAQQIAIPLVDGRMTMTIRW